MRAILENFPGGGGGAGDPLGTPTVEANDASIWALSPSYTVVRVEDNGNKGTYVMRIRYPDQSEWWMISLFELRDGLLYRQTSYFAAPFEAPDWRSEWVERSPERR